MFNLENNKIYLVTDNFDFEFHTLLKKIEESIIGGANIIQMREKSIDTLEFYNRALKIKDLCDKYNSIFIINDRIDIALAVDAHGVHLGQKDLCPSIARKILGDNKIIGISANTIDKAIEAQRNGADYIGTGAIFKTNTKLDAEYVDLNTLYDIQKAIHIPVYAIGGITKDNLTLMDTTKIHGIALCSTILKAPCPKEMSIKLSNYFK